MKEDRGAWRSRLGFILAAAGSAVGLGNLWKFPYLTYKFGGGEHGNGAGGFVAIYLLAVIFLGVPVMIAEVMIGRRGRLNPVGSFRALRPATAWKYAGLLGVVTGVLILSYYAVVAGWAIEYVGKSITWEYANYDAQVTDKAVQSRIFDEEAAHSPIGIMFLKDHRLIKDNAGPKEIQKAWAGLKKNKQSEKLLKQAKKALFLSFKARFHTQKALKHAMIEKKMEIYPDLLFNRFLDNPVKQIAYFFIFMALTMLVVIGGVSSGIERWNKVLMPLLLAMLLILVGRVFTLNGGVRALHFLFYPDFSTITFNTVLWAVGQAFFSLSLGMGALLTYGSYLPKDAKISKSVVAIISLDTLVALSAAFVIFGSIFTFGLTMSGSGIGNLFTAVPVIFLHMPGGRFLSIMFYSLVAFAALTSTVSLMEVAAAYLIDEHAIPRKKAVLIAGSIIFAIGVPSALSFNILAHAKAFGLTFFGLVDFFSANIALPLGGILIAIFVGWILTSKEKHEEVFEFPAWLYLIWNFLVRFIAPVAILVVLVVLLTGRVSG